MSEAHEREVAIFDAAIELPPAQRADYLDRSCGDDSALRQRIEALCQACERTSEFLDGTAPGIAAAHSLSLPGGPTQGEWVLRVPREKPGDMIGRYKLLQQIGEGGCGVVYMAEQVESVHRRVALKVIKLGMDTKSVIARFEAERQALAIMDHPNIAKVIDAGATETGRPYFVMELVRGMKITEYCDEARLSTRQRLDLFIQVCQAIQHAHQKGIIHRDIKPSNILVTLNDGVAVPKVIDFGIAKATTGQRLTDKTLFTAFEQFIGTPAYMSPEQATMTSLDIDTRSDIYALGVLLYELLTGRTPFDSRELLQAGLDEMRRTIQEKEPLRPSNRISSLASDEQTTTARLRGLDALRLISQLRGDLDWIVIKALEKDRARRYETANGLASDIQRHLSNEPVRVRPPSAAYRFQKMVRRNKLMFAASSAVAAALLIGLGVSTWMFFKERASSQRAIASEKKAEAEALNSEREASRARRAEGDTKEALWNSYLAQAQARRFSGRMGRRFQSLEVIKKAADLRPSVELRNEAIACLTLSDLRTVREWDGRGIDAFVFDPSYELYAWPESPGIIHVRRVADDHEIWSISGFTPSTHGSNISCGFGPVNRILYTCNFSSRETEFKAFDVSLRKALFHTVGPSNYNGEWFSPDGKWRAIQYHLNPRKTFIAFYDGISGDELQRLPTGPKAIGYCFSPDGRLFATSGVGEAVKVWDWRKASVVQTLAIPSSINGLAWHPHGKRLAGAGSDGRAYIWDLPSEKVVLTASGHQSEVMWVIFNHGGDLLASRSWDGTLRLWNALTAREELRAPVDSWFFYPFSSDDRWLGYAPEAKRRGFWEVATSQVWKPLRFLSEGSRSTKNCAYSPDGRLLVSAHYDKTRLWDTVSGREIATLPGTPSCARFSLTGQELIICESNKLKAFPTQRRTDGSTTNLALGSPEELLSARRLRLAYFDKNKRTVAADLGGVIGVFDVATRRELRRFPTKGPVYSFTLSKDGRRCATWPYEGHPINVWDVDTGQMVKELPGDWAHGPTFSPDGTQFITQSVDNCVVWDTRSWERLYSFPRAGVGSVQSRAAFAPDGRTAAIAYSTVSVRLFDTANGSELATLEPPEPQTITWLEFSPNGSQLAVATSTDVIQLWDLRAVRQELAAMKLDWDMPPSPASTTKSNERSHPNP